MQKTLSQEPNKVQCPYCPQKLSSLKSFNQHMYKKRKQPDGVHPAVAKGPQVETPKVTPGSPAYRSLSLLRLCCCWSPLAPLHQYKQPGTFSTSSLQCLKLPQMQMCLESEGAATGAAFSCPYMP